MSSSNSLSSAGSSQSAASLGADLVDSRASDKEADQKDLVTFPLSLDSSDPRAVCRHSFASPKSDQLHVLGPELRHLRPGCVDSGRIPLRKPLPGGRDQTFNVGHFRPFGRTLPFREGPRSERRSRHTAKQPEKLPKSPREHR
mmetsp:Transcript_7419/g.14794  ORF Transcript_7419/g.14794 Transcript_7419/m.14794 type:complete len:143 (-) Transcript_7419:213-641(-)